MRIVLAIIIFVFLAGCGEVDVSIGGGEDIDPVVKVVDILGKLPTVESVSVSEIDVLTERYPSITIETAHYTIHTTATDRLILTRLPMLLESAWLNYSQFAPISEAGELVKGQVYYFRDRTQWLAYTRAYTGESAEVFARIDSGAYCYNDICVAWQISRLADFSVLTHEAWHQYCGLYMKSELPSWLAESSAVYLESYKWDAKGLVFSPKYNLGRLGSLRKSMESGLYFSVSQLVGSDPGAVLGATDGMSSDEKSLYVSGYYARLYALSRFMFEYEYGIYRRGYEQIFADAMRGELKLSEELKSVGEEYAKSRIWSMYAGRELFENYISQPSDLFEGQYQDYCMKLAGTVRLK